MKKYEYQSGESASISLIVNGVEKNVVFSGGRTNPFRVKPFLKTSDEALQKAIESLSSFGEQIREVQMPDDEAGIQEAKIITIGKIVTITRDGDNEGKDGDEGNPEGANEDDPAIYPDVIKVQDAREILIGEYGVKAGELPNKAAIITKAAELKVSFPNLPE